ncbi:HET-domain-containing protein [Microthyrium microscopicum]|uniref:HET-domain-containing protein n=1 Tax=Microthyrium microscopicum TaxID=703497 RepID=A0A6A6UM86_9PEZI|nr:HET-domain-containing protein [Microthyrium microscopicum]
MSQALYEDLKLDANQTRVLVLQPCRKDKDPIVCYLEIVDLTSGSSSINFEALSYVWGNLSDRRDIQIGPHVVAVTLNLEKALRCLRGRKRSRRLWVDAVSINQNDIPERNYQVKLMSSIYRDAKKVLVWLGESDKDIERTVKWMRRSLSPGFFDVSIAKGTNDSKWHSKTDSPKDIPASNPVTNWFRRSLLCGSGEIATTDIKSDHGMQKLLENPYWQRMWTCQEFALASWDPIVICGRSSFEASYLWPALHAKGLLQDMSMLWTEDGIINNGFTSNFPNIQTSILIRHAMDNRGLLPYRLEPSLGLFLSMTCARECIDPKDKIYALYGLVQHQDTLPAADYEKSTETIVKETLSFLINERDEVDVYSFLGTFSKSDKVSFSSWVPNLSDGSLRSAKCPAHFISREICSHGGFRFGGAQDQHNGRVSPDLTTLVVHGIQIDRLQKIFVLGNNLSQLRTQIIEIQELLKHNQSINRRELSMVKTSENQRPIAELINKPGVQNLWTTLAPRFDDNHGIKDMDSLPVQFEKFLGTSDIVDGVYPGMRASPALVQALEHMFGRSFFITEQGIFGVSVPDVQDGDELALLYGFKVPYILRRSPEYLGAHSEPFLMVGGAYVSGVMLGELAAVEGLSSRMKALKII